MESQLLGGIICCLVHEPELGKSWLSSIPTACFSEQTNRIVFEAAKAISVSEQRVDLESIARYLVKTEMIDDIGGFVRLIDLWEQACSKVEIEKISRELLSKSARPDRKC